MSKETDESRTSAEPVVAVHASRDNPVESDVVIEPVAVEIVEDIKIAPEPDIHEDDIRGQIYKSHSEKRDQESDDALDDDDDLTLDSSESKDIIKTSKSDSTPLDDSDFVDINVFGKVKQVLKTKVEEAGGVQVYQLREAAYEQMRINKQANDDITSRQKALDERERQLSSNKPPVPSPDQKKEAKTTPDGSTPTDDQTLEAMAQKYQDAVLDDEDNAPSILADMVRLSAKTKEPTEEPFDKVAFAQSVKDEIALDQRQSKVLKASNALIRNNPELNNKDDRFDPRLFAAIDDETTVVERQNPSWDPADVMDEALKRVKAWKGVKPVKTMTEKQELKRNKQVPKQGNQRFTAPPPATRATNSDYVAQMRRNRGQET